MFCQEWLGEVRRSSLSFGDKVAATDIVTISPPYLCIINPFLFCPTAKLTFFAHVSMPNDCACNERVFFFFFPPFSGTFLLLLHRLPWLCSRRCVSRAFTYVCVCARVPAFVCVVCFAVRSLVVCFCLVAVVSFGSRFFFFFFAYFFYIFRGCEDEVGASCSVLHELHLNSLLRLLMHFTRVK